MINPYLFPKERSIYTNKKSSNTSLREICHYCGLIHKLKYLSK